jgi:hypothetical protein
MPSETSNPQIILIGIAAVVLFIGRQFIATRLNRRLLLWVPLGLAYFGLPGLQRLDPNAALAVFVLDAAAAAGLGALRGLSFRVWRASDGSTWTQGSLLTLGLWAASIVVRVALLALGNLVLGVPPTSLGQGLLLLLAITLGAQNLVLWLRADASADASAASASLSHQRAS